MRRLFNIALVLLGLLAGLVINQGETITSALAAGETQTIHTELVAAPIPPGCESFYEDSVLVEGDIPLWICKYALFTPAGTPCDEMKTVEQVAARFDKAAGRKINGSWSMTPEGKGPAFVLTMHEPENIPNPFGVLEIEGEYYGGGGPYPTKYGAVWRCLTAKGMGVKLSPGKPLFPPKPQAVCMTLSQLKGLGEFVADLRDGRGRLSGIVVKLNQDWVPPSAGWIVQFNGQDVSKGFNGQTVSIWEPDTDECRPVRP